MALQDSEAYQLVRGFFRRQRPNGHGPYEEAQNGWTDDKPFRAVYSNGIFEGYDGSVWVFFKFPRDVKIRWTSDPSEVLFNQHFFLDVVDEVGARLDNQVEKSYNDIRRSFKILAVQEPWEGIRPFPGCTPAQEDYLRRVSIQLNKPEWTGYMGFRIAQGNILDDAYGVPAKVDRYLEWLKDSSSIGFEYYRQDYEDLYHVMVNNAGFLPLDFTAERNEDGTTGIHDYKKLTAWYDTDSPRYGYSRETQSAAFSEFVHGHSLLLNRDWGGFNEVKFHAIRPKQKFFMADPQSMVSQWGASLYRPDLNIVHVRIEGQIRSKATAERIFEKKYGKTVRKRKGEGSTDSSLSQTREDAQKRSKVDSAYGASRTMAMLDNVEITVGQLVTGETNNLPKVLSQHYLEAAPLVHRQPEALLATLPTYPKPVFRIRKLNDTRNELSNEMFAGVIAFSGLFRKTRPADTEQLFLGLSDWGFEYTEIYTDIAAAKRNNNVPGFCVTGRPGSGKALTLDTRVMTPQGHRNMGDLEQGDLVFASDGNAYPVTHATEVMHGHRVYQIRLSDKQVIRADAEHQWYVSLPTHRQYWNSISAEESDARVKQSQESFLRLSREYPQETYLTANQIASIAQSELGDAVSADGRWYRSTMDLLDVPYIVPGSEFKKYHACSAFRALSERMPFIAPQRVGNGVAQVMTTEQILDYMNSGKSGKVSIPLPEPVNHPHRELPVDPYILGIWLGDGETGSGRIASGNVGTSVDSITGLSDMDSLKQELQRAGIEYRQVDDYRISTYGLSTALKGIGVIHDKHIPADYLNSSYEQRLALLQGLLDSDGCVTSLNRIGFDNTNLMLIEQTADLIRSLGLRVKWGSCEECGHHCEHEYAVMDERKTPAMIGGREVVSRRQNWSLQFNTTIPMFRIPRKLNKQMEVCQDTPRLQSIFIESIEEIESEPVRCISVASPDSSYLVEGGVITHNTQFMLQLIAQICYMNYSGVYLNPKNEGTLKPFFDFLGGLTVILTPEYMLRNPGILDPVFYHDAISQKAGDTFETGRRKVAKGLSNAIIMGSKILYTDEDKRENEAVQDELRSEILERAMDPRNRCSGHIIFGNPEAGTEGISNKDFKDQITNKMATSPFWKGYIGETAVSSGLQQQMMDNRIILIEWGSNLDLPGTEVEPKNYDASQIDSILSINVAFEYATEIASLNRAGGAIIADEAWVFKHSPQTRAHLNKGAREWREGNMMFVLGSQEIQDFAGKGEGNMMSYFARFLFLAIKEKADEELDLYFDRTGLPRTEANKRYILDAGTDKKSARAGMGPPRGFYIDTINNWSGGMICGPYPALELEKGRTDKIEEDGVQEADSTSAIYGGVLSALVDEGVREASSKLEQDSERASSMSVGGAESSAEQSRDRSESGDGSPSRQQENVDISLESEEL